MGVMSYIRAPFAGPGEKGGIAGWSSPVARQAHNLKVTGSNPVPATNLTARRRRANAGSPLKLTRINTESPKIVRILPVMSNFSEHVQ